MRLLRPHASTYNVSLPIALLVTIDHLPPLPGGRNHLPDSDKEQGELGYCVLSCEQVLACPSTKNKVSHAGVFVEL